MKYGFNKLLKVMKKLRSRNGCPWDKEQNEKTIIPYLIEETYEVVDSINKENPALIKEELGDLLLQIVFLSQMASEKKEFTINDVTDSIVRKLIRRHPHVFGNTRVSGPGEVIRNWEEIKNSEKETESILDSVPQSMPGLLRAKRVQEKASRVGFKWKEIKDVEKKINEEFLEFREALKSGENIEEEFGDLLFSLVTLSEFLKIDSEQAVHKTTDKFIKRFKYIEQKIKAENKKFKSLKLEELEKLWNEAKFKNGTQS